jgi:hypothetical protein
MIGRRNGVGQFGLAFAVLVGLTALQPRPAREAAAAPAAAGPRWFLTTVVSADVVGQFAALAFDPSSGVPHIGYYNATKTDLGLAHYAPGAGDCIPNADWDCLGGQSASDVGRHLSLSFRDNNTFATAFIDATDSRLQITQRYPNGLSNHWVDTAASGPDTKTSVRYDLNDAIHVAYQKILVAPTSALRYARAVNSGGNCGLDSQAGDWDCQTIESGAGVGGFASLDLTVLGSPRIAYRGAGATHTLKYAYPVSSNGNCGPSNTWRCDTIDSVTLGNDTIDGVSLHVAKCFLGPCTDRTRIAYLAAGYFKLAELVGGGGGNCGPSDDWRCTRIELVGSARGVSLAIDGAGDPLIAYQDDYGQANAVLKVARPRLLGNCGPSPGNLMVGTWQCEVIDDGVRSSGVSPRDVGQYVSLAFGPTGLPMIAYNDATDGDLLVAYQRIPLQINLPAILR